MLPWQMGAEQKANLRVRASAEHENAQLLARLRRGEEAAATLLYRRYADDVHRLLWRLLGADNDHDDLVNEVFVRVFANIRQVKEASKLRSWMLSVAVNLVRNEIRRRSVRRRFIGKKPPAEHHGAKLDDHHGRDLVARAFAILERMPVDERLAFTLRRIDGRKLEETAELCGCSLATVKRRLTRANDFFLTAAMDDPALAERLKQSEEGRP